MISEQSFVMRMPHREKGVITFGRDKGPCHPRHDVRIMTPAGRIRTENATPPLRDQPAPGLSSDRGRLPDQLPPTPQGRAPSLLKILYKRTLRRLSSLPLAISEMFLIAGLSAVGTFIEQNKPIQYYLDNYPDGDQKVGRVSGIMGRVSITPCCATFCIGTRMRAPCIQGR